MGRVESLGTEYKFKKTEIGKIPVDWEVKTLKEVLSLNYGDGLREGKRKGDKYPVFGSNGIIGYHDSFLVKGPGIIIGRKGTVGSITWSTEDYWPIDTTYYVVPCIGDVDLKWLYYILKILKLYQLNAATGIPGLNRSVALNVKIPFPSLSEQKKIAEILISVDEAVEKKQEIIEKTKMLKKGLMQELLTRGIGHKKFKKTEIGEIPMVWEVDKVEDVCEKPEYGYTESATEKPIGPKFLRISDIQDGKVNWESVPFCYCPNSIKEKYILKPGNILFARTGATTGKSYIIIKCPEAVFASYLIRVVTKERVNSNFLYLVFNSFIYWRQIKERIGGSAQGGVNALSLSRIKVPLPPLNEQKKIAEILTSVDEEIEKEVAQKERIENIKKGLMQALLTGKIRVKI